MSQLARTTTPQIKIINGHLNTTSLDVADYFGRQHRDVTRKIENLDCSTNFATANFYAHAKTIKTHNGGTKEIKFYNITRDGFTLLAMGFTGKIAMGFKEGYIEAFNKMETELLKKYEQPAIPSTVSPEQQRIIQEAVAELAHDNKAYAKYYGIIKTHFKIAKYDQLPADKLEEALEILQGVVVQPEAIAESAKINEFNEPAKIAEPSWDGELLEYAGKSIRILMRDNEPWFLAADVCQFFGFNQAKHLGTFASPEDKAYHSAADPNGHSQAHLLLPLSIILISASQCRGAARQSAKLFIHWLCAVAMPSLLAKTTLLSPVVVPAPEATIPDDMIMVNRTNFMALKNRVVLIYKRQRELDAIKASIDPIIAQLDALKNDVGDYVHNTTDPVREANLMATTLGGSDLPDVKALV